MIVLRAESVNELFVAAGQAILEQGVEVAPRGYPTLEVLGATFELTDPRRRLLDVPPVRILNPAFAVAESLWIAAGSDEPWIFNFNSRLRLYADGGVLRGAYGRRMRQWPDGKCGMDQLHEVLRLLRADPHSRQAVVQIFDPSRDYQGHRDVPCTLNYRFYIRGARLHMHTTMRSQDLWFGFGYDLFSATVIHEMMAQWLNVDIGTYTHHVDSLHVYMPQLAGITQLPKLLPRGEVIPIPAVEFDDVERIVAAGLEDPRLTQGSSTPWAEAAVVMRSYMARIAGDQALAESVLAQGNGELSDALRRWYASRTRR